MMRSTIWRWMKIAALATALATALGSVAWGYDDDDYHSRRDEARERGYQNGYQDGLRAGHYDRDRGSHFHFKNDQWEDAHGYEHWMGNHGHYKQAYREAYERGYRRAYGDDNYRYRDRDDYRGYNRGMRLTFEAPFLRHFTAHLEPLQVIAHR